MRDLWMGNHPRGSGFGLPIWQQVDDLLECAAGGLTRDPNKPGTYSASGIYGDATLATREKGEILVNAMVQGILKEIEALRRAEVASKPK